MFMDKNIFCERLKSKRKEHKLSQDELASKLGISRYSVIDWEKAKKSPDIQTLANICEILGTTISYLVGETDKPDVETQLLGKGFPKERHQDSMSMNPLISAGAKIYSKKSDRKPLLAYDESDFQNMKASDVQNTVLTLGSDTIALLLRDKVKSEVHQYDKIKREIIAQALHETLATLAAEDNKKTDEKTA